VSARPEPSPAAPPSRERGLWFGLLAAPLAWTIHEVAGYALAGSGCHVARTHLPSWSWLGLLGVSALAAGLASWGGLVALRELRRAAGPVGSARVDGRHRAEFMAAAGVLVSALLLLNIVMFAVMPLLVDRCRAVT
jgi:hypothetical protein